MSQSTVYSLTKFDNGQLDDGVKAEYELGYRGLNNAQLQQVVTGDGVAEVRLDADQVAMNQGLLNDDQEIRAAERGGELSVLITAKLVD